MKKEPKNNRELVWVVKTFRPWLPAVCLLAFCYVASAVLSVWFALGFREVIDMAEAGDRDAFIWACVKQGAIVFSLLLDSTLLHHLKEKMIADMDRAMKRKFLSGLLRGEYAKISGYHTGELLNRMNGDVRILISSVLNIIPSIANIGTKLVAVIGVLAALEPTLTAIVVAAGILVVLVTTYVRRKLKSLNKRASAANGKVSGFIQETLEKLLMVQAMDIAAVMEKRSDVLLEQRYQLQRKRKNISVISSTCMSLLGYGASFCTLVWCASGVLNGTMTFGTMTAINQLVGQLQAPFLGMSGITPQYAAMSAAADRLMELESICNTVSQERKDAEKLYEDMEFIRADTLSFAYDRDYVFDEANFRLPKGSFGVIVGHSGIGKSTLLKLLLGVFPAKSGGLYIEGEGQRVSVDYTTRNLFAYVPQGNLLLSGSLRDNLLVTNENATQEEIDRAIYVSAMDAYLPTLPEGLDTVVGENALGLSEGQAQRLSIARAILSNAPILLLDEATSALDDETERLVLQRIRQLPGKTCIAVTHRDAATQIADWKLHVREGKCTVEYL